MGLKNKNFNIEIKKILGNKRLIVKFFYFYEWIEEETLSETYY